MKSLGPLAIFGFVVMAIPITGTGAAIVNLVPAYYAEVLGVSLSSVGLVLFVLRLFDAVTDPAMGWLLDRRPFSRDHKPWILISLPLFLAGIVLLFRPIESIVGIPYLMGAGFLVYVAYTIGLVAHQAWGASLASDAAEVSQIMAYRELAVIVGILGVFLAPALGESMGYEGLEAKVMASTLYMLGCFVIFGPICLLLAPDERRTSQAEPISLEEARRFLARHDFLWVSIANLAINFAMVGLSVITYFIAAWVFDAPDRYGVGMAIYFVAAFAGMPGWMAAARRFGDARTLRIAFVYVALGTASIPFWAGLEFEARYLVFMSLLGLGFGAPPFLIRALVGQLANAHEAEHGPSVRGNAYAVTTFFDKLGSGVAAGAVLPLVEWLGFDAATGGGVVGRSALIGVATGVPILGFGVAAIAMVFAARAASSDEPS